MSWFEHADPPINVLVADDRLSALWHPPGSQADVVVLDLQLTPTRGQEFLALRALVDGGRNVVVYTQDLSRDTAVRCIDIGALAFVTKSEGKEHLVAAVRAAAQGRPYTPPTLSGSMLADDAAERPRLTAQESAALRAWFASSSKTLAAAQLGISPKTLDTYIGRARVRYANVGRAAKTKSELVARALEDGLIGLDELGPRDVR